MTIYLLADPLENSYVISLIDEYKRIGHKVYCGSRNFLVSNLIPDILHIQWPEKMYNNYPFSTFPEDEKLKIIEEKLVWYKKNRTIIIQTIHNLQPHNPKSISFEKNVYGLVIKYSDILIHHCQNSAELIKKNYSGIEKKLNVVNHHPDYLYDYVHIKKEVARKKLGLPKEKFIILNFGSQQKYKGEDFIESVFKKLKMKDKFLLTAGNYVYDGFSNIVLLKLRNKLRQKLIYPNKKYVYNKIMLSELPLFFLHGFPKNSLSTN